MSSERLQRDQCVLNGVDGYVMNLYPIHFAGMAVFARNDANVPSTLQVHESADGITWNLVLVSTFAAAGLPSVTLAELSFRAILFESNQPFVRISLTANNPQGVYCSLVQYPPKPRVPAAGY